jgi:hypothetical protein
MQHMKKFILSLLTIVVSANVMAEGESNLKASVNAGYTSNYIVNGLAKTGSQTFVGVDIGTQYYGIDTYVGAVTLNAGEALGELHGNMGIGKAIEVFDGFSLRGDAQVFQHQVVQGASSTEARLSLSLDNEYITPYVIGTYDLDISGTGYLQKGYIVGVKKSFDIDGFFTITPSIEYGKMTDYDVLGAKLDVSRIFWEKLELFGSVGWFDNNFDVTNYNFAVEEFTGDIAASAGVRWNF